MRRVNPSVYTKNYYLTACSGFGCFKRDCGKTLEPRMLRIVQDIRIKKGGKVLDIGCGRGELCFWAAGKGAEAIGIDYSKEAVKLAKKAWLRQPGDIRRKTSFLSMDAKSLSFADKTFDFIFMVEVFEHLYPEEQKKVLSEIRRVLKDEGIFLLHTAPTRWFNDFTYRFWCYPVSWLLSFVWKGISGRIYAGLPGWERIRNRYEKLMHVGESNFFSLWWLMINAGFKGKIKSTNITVIKPVLSWRDTLFNFFVYLYPLSNHFPINVLYGNDLYAVLKKR